MLLFVSAMSPLIFALIIPVSFITASACQPQHETFKYTAPLNTHDHAEYWDEHFHLNQYTGRYINIQMLTESVLCSVTVYESILRLKFNNLWAEVQNFCFILRLSTFSIAITALFIHVPHFKGPRVIGEAKITYSMTHRYDRDWVSV